MVGENIKMVDENIKKVENEIKTLGDPVGAWLALDSANRKFRISYAGSENAAFEKFKLGKKELEEKKNELKLEKNELKLEKKELEKKKNDLLDQLKAASRTFVDFMWCDNVQMRTNFPPP